MHDQLPIELYLPNRPGTPGEVEHMCDIATTQADAGTVAIAVAARNVSRAASLLFGTGIGVVGCCESAEDAPFVNQARLSVAAGATEVALPSVALDRAAVLEQLKAFLGTTTPLTVDVTTPAGDVSLDHAEHALVLGADYVGYSPTAETTNASGQLANLVALAGELQLGGVKLAGAADHRIVVLRENAWAMRPGNTRVCVPVGPSRA